ncbi:MAG TPA: group II intron reverse transcriptase/maturase [Phycisphaerae bacterium]|nr:group II intron reverse transcriptase/maturase [Phycisphaerae bacterium]
MSLPKPLESVERLQTSLQTKAKAEPAFRFYALWDKVYRKDVLLEAYQRCRANTGAPGVDRETFEVIETQGVERWLGTLREELSSGNYVPRPLLRVWIPKSNGGQRPLGIPTIRDRVAQMAVVLVIGPIFEADLLPQQYGFRPGMDAKMALRRVYWHVTQHGRREVVDADLRDYFTSIPHGPLMRCLSRRIVDGRMLRVIKSWLTAPVVENIDGRTTQTAEARRRKRGTPQGGVISPLLANCYFRRFLLAWHGYGHQNELDAYVVNYADDLVICCGPGNAAAALARMSVLMTRLGLEVNTAKTRIARLPEESFDFLGYTVGRFFGKGGRPYVGTRPSKKSVKSLLRRIHARTSHQWYVDEPKNTVARLSSMLRGWCGYFDQGPVMDIYELVRAYTDRRVRRWLMRRTGRRGVGFRQIPDEYLYETLGLYSIPRRRVDLPRAKV